MEVSPGDHETPLPHTRESSGILGRPQGDSLSHWIPVCTGMGKGELAGSALFRGLDMPDNELQCLVAVIIVDRQLVYQP